MTGGGRRWGRMEDVTAARRREEGEVCGGDEVVDPDELTYIDEKLQNVLGHFQKEFEAGVSAENLGLQYGGYGSFLSTYQGSPSILSQSRSPAVRPNCDSGSRSPYTVESAQKTHIVKQAIGSRGENNCCQRMSNENNSNHSQHMLNSRPKQKAPKIRIKVINKCLERNNAAIYCGLGLNISPSSSMDDSPKGSIGAPKSILLPDESADTIFQTMTCHSVPGGSLLSPLAENVLDLRKKSTPATKKHEAPAYDNGKAELQRDCCCTTSSAPDNNYPLVKKIKCDELKDHRPDLKSSKCRHNNATLLKKGASPKFQDTSVDTDSILLTRSTKTEKHGVEKSTEFITETSDLLKETKNGPSKGKGTAKSSLTVIDVKVANVASDDKHLKGKTNIKETSVRNAFEDCSKESKMEPSLDYGFSHNIKSDEYNDQPVTNSSQLQIDPLKKTSLKKEKRKVVHVKEYRSKELGSLVDAQSMGITTENVMGNSFEVPKGNKVSSFQASLSGKKLKVKVHKKLNNGTTRKPNGEDEGGVLDHRIGLSDLYPEEKSLKTARDTVTSRETDKDWSGGGNDGDHTISPMFIDKSAPVPSSCNNKTTQSSAPEPVLIREQWVFCDKCRKWRLLPYGMNPAILPKKWRCSMQSWLPGMNNCKIAGDETTKATRALYMVPAPENNISLDNHYDTSTSGIHTAPGPTFEGDMLKVRSNGSKKLHAHRNPGGIEWCPKLREKRKHVESLDKGEIVAKDRMHLKRKSSGGADYSNLITSKKLKKVYHEPAKHHPSDPELSKSSPSTKETLKNLLKHSSISPGMGKYASPSSAKQFSDGDKVFLDQGTRTSDAGQSDLQYLSIEKRKSKQMHLSQHGPDPLACDALAKHVVKEALSKSNSAKEKLRSDMKFLEVDDHRKSAQASDPVAGIDSNGNGIHAEREGLSEQNLKNIHFHHPLLSESSVRRNMCYAQASTAATSSSSKVSSSHRPKPEFQETRASPVESVSSSPLRTSKKRLDQHRKNPYAVAENVHSQESAKAGSPCSKEKYGSDHTKPHGSGCSNVDMHQDALEEGDLQKDKQDILTNGCSKNRSSGLGIRNGHGQLNSVVEQKVNLHVLSMHDNGDFKRPTSHQNVKTLPHYNSNQSNQAKLSSGKHPTQVKPDRGNVEYRELKTNASTVEGSKQLVALNNRANGDASYKANQSNKTVVENIKHRALNVDASTLINASVLLKEARDLKHLSDRLKGNGDDLESANMCFEACLKFLHVASLKESPSIDSSKPGGLINTMTLYSDTGNLCGFCAREFERLKKMANASLAYKCVEVAYMKAAFYKNPAAIKDGHALQSASVMVPPAESPSSSASDVDNLNNLSTVAKIVSTRGVCSSHIATNSISRNNHHLMGLLAYAEDINYAFEGTRKSQSTFSAYLSGIEKDQADAIALLRELLNFNFHNVKGLLQLIRRSLECINNEIVK
ncbi:hypothetical protein GUJ93_ZPchr0005g15424 [Zizania palustris]|uniref:CW-type domain-containing protein n=1 Tax=Zizania palustris TaxID=103762 RepID=A0A8J5S365_ZIZPA|nr:hypothetical protein GUJ93_ZPchr0005g15424 [Zizania palustris]